METLIEPIRYTVTVFGLVTAATMVRALRSGGHPLPRLALPWLVTATGLALVVSHVLRGAAPLAMVPLVTGAGVALGIAAQFSASATRAFAALDDKSWRLLTMTRGVFGALILGACAVGLFPPTFALPAGLGDLAAAALAMMAPGSLAPGGNRGWRLLVFGFGLLDFAQVMVLLAKVQLPFLAATHTIGISVMLPWVVVPMLVTLNLFGLRFALAESSTAKVPVSA
jgi:hypothetical protein